MSKKHNKNEIRLCTSKSPSYQSMTEDSTQTTVTAWEVKGNVSADNLYERLIKEFGCEKIDSALLERFRKVTGHEPHKWLRRGIFFAHRGLNEILVDHE